MQGVASFAVQLGAFAPHGMVRRGKASRGLAGQAKARRGRYGLRTQRVALATVLIGVLGRIARCYADSKQGLCSANIGFGTNCRRCGTVAELWHDPGVITLARIVLRLLADLASLVARSATPLTRHRIGEHLEVRARSVPGGLHHEYLPAPALA